MWMSQSCWHVVQSHSVTFMPSQEAVIELSLLPVDSDPCGPFYSMIGTLYFKEAFQLRAHRSAELGLAKNICMHPYFIDTHTQLNFM